MKYIILRQVKKRGYDYYKVFYKNGVYLGDIISKEDGFYDFWPDYSKRGCWSAYVLRELADKLDEMNAPWEKDIEEYFSQNKQDDYEYY